MGFFDLILLGASTGLVVIATWLISRATFELIRLRLLINTEMREAFGWCIAGTIAGVIATLGLIVTLFFALDVVFIASPLLILVNLAVIGAIGVFSAFAARRMRQSSKFDDVQDTAHRDAIWSALFSLGTVGLVVLYFIISLFRKVDKNNKDKKEQKTTQQDEAQRQEEERRKDQELRKQQEEIKRQRELLGA